MSTDPALDAMRQKLLDGITDPVKTTSSDGQLTANQDVQGMIAALKYIDERADVLAAREAALLPGAYAPIRLVPR